jgi:myosin heavy subunit
MAKQHSSGPVHLKPLLCAALLSLVAHQALAADNSREREALRRAQLSVQQAQQERDTALGEKASLAQEKSKLAGELSQVSTQVRSAQLQSTSFKQQVARLNTELSQQKAEVLQAQQREEALQEQLKAMQAKHAELSRVVDSLATLLIQRTQDVRVLNTANQAMYALGLDLIELQRSQSSSVWLKASDAVLGHREVKLENQAEAMRDKLEAARFKQAIGEDAVTHCGGVMQSVPTAKDAAAATGK